MAACSRIYVICICIMETRVLVQRERGVRYYTRAPLRMDCRHHYARVHRQKMYFICRDFLVTISLVFICCQCHTRSGVRLVRFWSTHVQSIVIWLRTQKLPRVCKCACAHWCNCAVYWGRTHVCFVRKIVCAQMNFTINIFPQRDVLVERRVCMSGRGKCSIKFDSKECNYIYWVFKQSECVHTIRAKG